MESLKLYTLETNILYFFGNKKYGRWVNDPKKYRVTKESRNGGPFMWCVFVIYEGLVWSEYLGNNHTAILSYLP
jgi:hypothetical protein